MANFEYVAIAYRFANPGCSRSPVKESKAPPDIYQFMLCLDRRWNIFQLIVSLL